MHATRGALLATLLGALSVCAKSRYKTHGGPLPGGPKQVREYTLDIDYFPYNADGRTIFAMGANGQFPAPAIEANVNDTLIVWVNNRMKTEAVSIHWHGLEQRLRPWMDGVVGVTQCAIAPNTSFKYVFEITEHPGTYWYHNHNGLNKVGARALQGALIIHARNKSEEIHGKDYDEERTFMLQDWFTDTEVMEMDLALGGQNPPLTITREFMISSSVPYDGLLINGLGWNGPPGHQPPFGRYDSPPPPLEFRDIINVRPKSNAWGGRYRLRLTNAGASFSVQFCVDDHRLTVIASDGADTLPFEVDCVNIAPAERYDVILTADQRLQNYWIRSSTLERDYNHTAYAVVRGARVRGARVRGRG